MAEMRIIQDEINEWADKKGFKWSDYANFCHLVEEVGELGEAITVRHEERAAGSGELGDADHSDIEEEIGDVLFSAIVLAGRFEIDVEACLSKTIIRYDQKLARRSDQAKRF